MSDSASNIVEKIDALLEDDNNFSTRIGLRFMTTVLKDAMLVIGDVVKQNSAIDQRLREIDKAFLTFMQQQTKKEAQAAEERTKWRWVIISPTIALVIAEILRWIFR